jgi:small redox-active disulfide protein 2
MFMKKVDIIVLGPGCPNCLRLESMCRETAASEGVDAEIHKITDYEKFADYGVYVAPGLIINGKLMLSGKMPAQSTLENWIRTAAKE